MEMKRWWKGNEIDKNYRVLFHVQPRITSFIYSKIRPPHERNQMPALHQDL
jgi:hypothetical protein